MVYDHYQNHLAECEELTSNIRQFGRYCNDISKILNISNTSCENIRISFIQEQANLTDHGLRASGSNFEEAKSPGSKSEEAKSSGSVFNHREAPANTKKYNDTKKLRKEVASFLEQLQGRYELSPEEFQLNVLKSLLKQTGIEENLVKIGYIKIYNILKYMEILK